MRRFFGIVAILLLSTAANAQVVIPDPTPLRIIDSAGRVVGNVAGIDLYHPFVSFKFDSIHFALAVTRQEFKQLSTPALFYASTDCSGPAFLLDSSSLFAPARLEGTTLFVADTRLASHSEVLNSSGVPGSCSAQPRTSLVFNTIVLTNFTSQWTAPFTVRSALDGVR